MNAGVPFETHPVIGLMDSEPNVRNKISRSKFTAVVLIQCLEAIGASSLRFLGGWS